MTGLDLFGLGQMPPVLVAVVFAASALQAVTGIGFGVIAGPVLLVTMGSSGAIQVSILLSFLISLVLAPMTLRQVNPRLLRPLLLGVCLGSPLGALAFHVLTIGQLKTVAAVVVFAMTLIAAGVLSRFPLFEQDSPARRRAVGVVCGVLNTTLAMPGPPVAAYATAIRSSKDTVRATTLVTFLLAYPIALGFQAVASGISAETLPAALALCLPVLAGTGTGLLIARRLPPALFRLATIGFLAASAAVLVIR